MTSFRFKRTPRRKQYMRFITRIHELLEDAYWEENQKSKLNKTTIAAALGVHKSYITRLLNGSSNMTFETFSNLAHELNRDISIDLVRRDNVDKRSNVFVEIKNPIQISEYRSSSSAPTTPIKVHQ